MSAIDEAVRQRTLGESDLLCPSAETDPEQWLQLVAQKMAVPIAGIGLIDGERQWFEALFGMPKLNIQRRDSFCAHTIEGDAILLVPDARLDPRFRDSPLVVADPQIRFYAGVPLRNSAGLVLGSLAVCDCQPRVLPQAELDLLQRLAGQAVLLLELRLQRRRAALQSARLQAVQDATDVGIWELHLDTDRWIPDPYVLRLFGCDSQSFEACRTALAQRVLPDDRTVLQAALARAVELGDAFDIEYRICNDDGTQRHVRERVDLHLSIEGNERILLGTVQDVSGARATQARLADQQSAVARLHDTLNFHIERSPLAFVEWDSGFRVVRWSQRAEALFGWTAAEVMNLGAESWPFIHPDDVDAVAKVMQRLAQGKESRNVSFNRNLTRNGTELHCAWYNSVLLDEQGKIASSFSLVQDLTDHTRIEQDRRQLASRLDATLENMGDAFYLLDRAWRFVYVNQQAERILRRMRSEILGQSLWELFPEASETELHATYHRVLEQQRAESLELYYAPLQDWLEINATPSPEGLAVYFRQVNARKNIELALRASEERFRLLSKATNDAIWDWDLSTQTLWWNEGFENLFGFRRDEVEAGVESWSNRIHPDDRQRITADVQRTIEQGVEQWSGQYRFMRKGGSYATVLDRGHVIRDAEGVAVRMVGGMTDLSERIALEEQLHQAQRMESIGQLTGGIAHDFNNLLTVILGNAELLTEALRDRPRLAELASMIETASTRGADLTHRLLAFARRQALQPGVVDLQHLIGNMEELLRRTLGEHIELGLLRSANLWRASVDSAQLESAVLNLCINARDAMPKGGRLTIETTNIRLDENYATHHGDVVAGEYVMLAVTDSGSGIAPELLSRVFEPFFTTKEKGKGTGLGLAMVFGFVKQSQGHVSIYSEYGEGTTIKLYFPRIEDGTEASTDTDRAESQPIHASTTTVLMVEDDPLVRHYAEEQLRALGYHVLVAENGPQALDLVRRRSDIDLLFTDVVMPGGMGGRQLAEAALALRPELRVLYTSGYTENAIVHAGRLDPGVLLLGKPYRRADLARKIAEALGPE